MLLLTICYIAAIIIFSLMIRSWREDREFRFEFLAIPIILFWSLSMPVLMTQLSGYDILEFGTEYVVSFILSGILLAMSMIGLRWGNKTLLFAPFLFVMMYAQLELAHKPILIVVTLLEGL